MKRNDVSRALRSSFARSLIYGGLLVVIAGCGSDAPREGIPVAIPDRADFPAHLSRQLQARLDSWVDSAGRRGVSAAVVLPNGALWAGVSGVAGPGEPLRVDHLISIASITKSQTGALILQLADEGALSLEDSIGHWLPPQPGVASDITLRQLLDHSAGLHNYTLDPRYGPAIRDEPDRRFEPGLIVTEFAGEPQFEAGSDTQYTNSGFILLGLVAERATGRSLGELYEMRLWSPNGLRETVLPSETPDPRMAHGWELGEDGLREVDPKHRMAHHSSRWSAFGLYASARDVARWGHALFAGEVISDSLRSQMLQARPAAGNIPVESGVGLGVRQYRYFDEIQWGHSGGSAEGSSLMLFDPASRVTVAVLSNQPGRSTGGAVFFLAPEVLTTVRNHLLNGAVADE